MDKFIITGAPGTGKTSIIESLKNKGYKTYEEIPRKLIENNVPGKAGIEPFQNLSDFAELVFNGMFEQYLSSIKDARLCFFDRGIPDVFAYLHNAGINIKDNYYKKYSLCKYNETVFLCPPWEKIYISDDVRPYNFTEIAGLGNEIIKIYTIFNFRIFTLPLVSIEERVDIILKHIQQNKEMV